MLITYSKNIINSREIRLILLILIVVIITILVTPFFISRGLLTKRV